MAFIKAIRLLVKHMNLYLITNCKYKITRTAKYLHKFSAIDPH